MKKIISIALTVAMLLSLAIVPVSADGLVSYTEDFSGELDWLGLKVVDNAAGAYTDNVASVVTKAFGDDANNKAAQIYAVGATAGNGVGSDAYYGVVQTTATYNANRVPADTSVISFDMMLDSQCAKTTANGGVRNQDNKLFYINGALGLYLVTGGTAYGGINKYTDKTLGDIAMDTWTRYVIEYDKSTNKANYTIIHNVDKPAEAAVYTTSGTLSSTAWAEITALEFTQYRIGSKYYVDNVSIKEVSSHLALSSTSIADDATEVATDSALSFTFNNDIASANIKVNGAAANFNVDGNTATYTGTLAASTTHTVTGYVTDAYGMVEEVDLTFTTEREPYSYVTGFEDSNYSSWATVQNVDTNNTGITYALVTDKAYGDDTDNKALEIKAGAAQWYDYGRFYASLSKTVGKSVFLYDFIMDSSTERPGGNSDVTVFTIYAGEEGADTAYEYRYIYNGTQVEGIYKATTYTATAFPSNARPDDDTWARLIFEYDPETGLADITVIKNIADPENSVAGVIEDYQLTDANADGIKRFLFAQRQSNSKMYYDNIALREVSQHLALSGASIADDATEVATDSTLSFTFNNDIAGTNIKVNGTTANFNVNGSTATYAGTLAGGTTYTVTGYVTDTYGMVEAVDLTFTTERKPVNLLIDFEDDSYKSWGEFANENYAGIATMAYGTDADNKAARITRSADSADSSAIGYFNTYFAGKAVSESPLYMAASVPSDYVLNFDMMFENTTNPNFNEYWPVKVGFRRSGSTAITTKDIISMCDRTNSGDKQRDMMLNLEDVLGRVNDGNTRDNDKSFINAFKKNTWYNVAMAISPSTGRVSVSVYEVKETGAKELVGYYNDYTSWNAANNEISLCSLSFTQTRNGDVMYIDNIEVKEIGNAVELENAGFVDEAGETVTGESIAKPTYEATVKNNTDGVEEMMLFVTAKDSDGKLVDYTTEKITLNPGESKDVSESFTSADVSGYKVEAFYWRLANLVPMSDRLEKSLLTAK